MSSPVMLEIFITFPVRDQRNLAIGDTVLDYLEGVGILPGGSKVPMSRPGSPKLPLRYIYFNTDQNINVVISYKEEVQFSGFIPAGAHDIHDITFDHVVITAAVAVNANIVASTSKDAHMV